MMGIDITYCDFETLSGFIADFTMYKFNFIIFPLKLQILCNIKV